MNQPAGIAFNSSGDLFEAESADGVINEFSPNGTKTTYATGLYQPDGIAFNPAGDMFVADFANFGSGAGIIYEYTPTGVRSTFATGLTGPSFVAFGPTSVPEPSSILLLLIGVAAIVRGKRTRVLCRVSQLLDDLKLGPVRTKLWRSITSHDQHQGNNDDRFYHGYANEQQYECTDRVQHGSPKLDLSSSSSRRRSSALLRRPR